MVITICSTCLYMDHVTLSTKSSLQECFKVWKFQKHHPVLQKNQQRWICFQLQSTQLYNSIPEIIGKHIILSVE